MADVVLDHDEAYTVQELMNSRPDGVAQLLENYLDDIRNKPLPPLD